MDVRRLLLSVLASLLASAVGAMCAGAPALALETHLASAGAGRASANQFDSPLPAVEPDGIEAPPEVTTEAASEVQLNSATLNGAVNPEGAQITACYFEYFETYENSHGPVNTAQCAQSPASIGAGSGPVPVNASVSGLKESSRYIFRLVAVNANGASSGGSTKFVTPGLPVIQQVGAEAVMRTSATLTARIEPSGSETSYHFEYGTTNRYGTSLPVPDGNITVTEGGCCGADVSAAISGLQVAVTYHYRVVATSARGTIDGPDGTFETLPAVAIEQTSVVNVTSSTARLLAQIDPQGLGTTYHFEYGTSTVYGTSVPVPDAEVGSGEGGVIVTQDLSGLQSNTTYHYRVVATNSLGTTDGPDELFTTEPASCPNAALRAGASAHLPDCRSYELVTPPDKLESSQDLTFGSGAFVPVAIPAVDGNRLALDAPSVTFGPNPMNGGTFAVFARTATGWETISVNPPGSGDFYESDVLFSPDLIQTAVHSQPRPYPPATETFATGPVGGPYSPLAVQPFDAEQPTELVAATPNLGRIVLYSPDHDLLPGGAPTGTLTSAHDLYEWHEGQFSLLNVTTGGALVSPCGAQLHFLSEDGSTAVFGSPDKNASALDPSCEQPQRLYMRRNGRTVEISAPQGGIVDPAGPQPAEFEGASADGSKIFFLSNGELTPADAGNHELALYEYDTVTGVLTLVSRGPIEPDDVRVSSDGSTVYFESGAIERYDTETGVITDVTDGAGTLVQTTPNGRFLMFVAQSVAGFPKVHGSEVFRYDASESRLTCVSCPPVGVGETGGSFVPSFHTGVLQPSPFSGMKSGVPPYIAMSNDGSDVFFDSNNQLVPQDISSYKGGPDDPGVDVYEWHEGTVSLISSGTDPGASIFLGASEDGSNAFFVTHSQLVPQDTDSLGDIYDARIDGGFAVSSETAPCAGDACHNPAPLPNDPTPASATFSGPGNPAPVAALETGKPKVQSKKTKTKVKRCGRGRSHERGRCVKAHGAKGARRVVRRGRGGGR